MRHRIQMVFQDPYGSLDPHLTAQEIVAEPLQVCGERSKTVRAQAGRRAARPGRAADHRARPQAARVLRRPAPAHRHRPGARLRARPAGLDEATSALDVSVQAQVLDLLATCARTPASPTCSSRTTWAWSRSSARGPRAAAPAGSSSTAPPRGSRRPQEPYTRALRRARSTRRRWSAASPARSSVASRPPRSSPRKPAGHATPLERMSTELPGLAGRSPAGAGHDDVRRHRRRRHGSRDGGRPRSTPGSPPRHGQRLCRGEHRGDPRRGPAGRRDEVVLATKAGIYARRRRRATRCCRREGSALGGGQPAPAGHRPHRPVLPAPARPRDAAGRDRRRARRPRRRGQGRARSACPTSPRGRSPTSTQRASGPARHARSWHSSSTTSSRAGSRTSTLEFATTHGLRHHGLQPARRRPAHRAAPLRRGARTRAASATPRWRRCTATGTGTARLFDAVEALWPASRPMPGVGLPELSLRWLLRGRSSPLSCSAGPSPSSCGPTSPLPARPAAARMSCRLRRGRCHPARPDARLQPLRPESTRREYPEQLPNPTARDFTAQLRRA